MSAAFAYDLGRGAPLRARLRALKWRISGAASPLPTRSASGGQIFWRKRDRRRAAIEAALHRAPLEFATGEADPRG